MRLKYLKIKHKIKNFFCIHRWEFFYTSNKSTFRTVKNKLDQYPIYHCVKCHKNKEVKI